MRGAAGWSPYYIPVFDQPGRVAAFTDPDSGQHCALLETAAASWRNQFTPRFLFRTPKYADGTAERLRMPPLVCVAEHATDADPQKAIEIARKAPRGELASYPVRHFDVYIGHSKERILNDQVEFVTRVLQPHIPATE